MEAKKTSFNNKHNGNKNTLYTIKTTLFHKVRNYSFNEEERVNLERAVKYAESALDYDIVLEEATTESVTISIKNIPEKEKELAVKEVATKISGYMYVESEKVRKGLRSSHSFMFKGKEECPTEEIKQ